MLLFPVASRALPFATFIGLMILESVLKWSSPSYYEEIRHFLYPVRVVITTGVLVWLWIVVEKYRPSWRGMTSSSVVMALVAGFAVIVFWIAVGPLFRIGTPTTVNPVPQDPTLGALWLLSRFVGAALLVPIIEELFWRSYLARRIDVVEVDRLSPHHLSWRAIIASSIAFGLEHSEVLAGAVSGVVFCWLYKRYGDLRVAVLAHAVANGILFAYVVKFSAFGFWG
jgi:uncharacterized protein